MNKLYYKTYYLVILSLALISTIPCIGQTFITAGNVSGNWELVNSPYKILGEITIPNNETLTIEPGVNIIFLGHYKFNVQGRLLAVGKQDDSIRFTADNIETGWHGIRFNQTPSTNDTSKLIYCSFMYGKANTGDYSGFDRCGGAIVIFAFDKVLVSDCPFEFNMNIGNPSSTGGAVIHIRSASPILKNSIFNNNTGTTDGAIVCLYSSGAIISNNTFINNRGKYSPILCLNNYDKHPIISSNKIFNNFAATAGGGIFVFTSSALIINNLITHNQSPEGGGIKCYVGGNAICLNNTIVYNTASYGGGICCNQNSDPIFINNIVWGNTATFGNQVNLMDNASDPNFFYCDIQGGKDGFRGNGSGINYSGLYENIIDFDPLFVDATSENYCLTDYSRCIGAGIDSIEITGKWFYVPLFCLAGNHRPSPAGTMPDIGSYENLLPFPIVGISQESKNSMEFALFQNYPNPFNPSTRIIWETPVGSRQTLKIYDVLGKEIVTLVDEYIEAGRYEIDFNANALASGVYFYQLISYYLKNKDGRAEYFIDTKKMILLR